MCLSTSVLERQAMYVKKKSSEELLTGLIGKLRFAKTDKTRLCADAFVRGWGRGRGLGRVGRGTVHSLNVFSGLEKGFERGKIILQVHI